MKKTSLAVLTAALVAAAAGPVSAATIALATTGVYDTAVQTNQVDKNANGNAIGATGANDVAGFTTAVATAFAANSGGVVDFGTAAMSDISAINAAYGVGQAKTLNLGLSVATTNSDKSLRIISSGPSFTAISSTTSLFATAGSDQAVSGFTISIGSITNGAIGEYVSGAGLTVLSRNANGFATDVTVTANFSGGGNSVLTTSIGTGNPSTTTDSFYGFSAPTGQSITSLVVSHAASSAPGDTRVSIDDLGFITVPDPAPSRCFSADWGYLS